MNMEMRQKCVHYIPIDSKEKKNWMKICTKLFSIVHTYHYFNVNIHIHVVWIISWTNLQTFAWVNWPLKNVSYLFCLFFCFYILDEIFISNLSQWINNCWITNIIIIKSAHSILISTLISTIPLNIRIISKC